MFVNPKLLPSKKTSPVSGQLLVMLFLLFLTLLLTNLFKKLRLNWINEPLIATFVGAFAGFLLTVLSQNDLIDALTKNYVKLFLVLFLPPIIFERLICN